MKHLKSINPSDIVFLDIETVRLVETLEEGTPLWDSWEYTQRYVKDPLPLPESFAKEAALQAEFSRIACITVGRVDLNSQKIIIRTYSDTDERVLLRNFNNDLAKESMNNANLRLGGHAIIDFDIPFLMKRSLVNGVDLAPLIDVGGLKPWEVTTLDTKVLWRGTGSRNSSLITIATAFGLPSPKDDIDGSQVGDVYYNEGAKGLERICRYCEKDVITTMNVYLCIAGYPPILGEENIVTPAMDQVVLPLTILERIQMKGSLTQGDVKELQLLFKDLSDSEKGIAVDIVKAALLLNGDQGPVNTSIEKLKQLLWP